MPIFGGIFKGKSTTKVKAITNNDLLSTNNLNQKYCKIQQKVLK